MVILAVHGGESKLWWEFKIIKKDVVNSNKSDTVLVEDLNQCYLRFDSHNFSDKLAKM